MPIDVTKFEVEKTHFWIPTYNRFNNIQTVSLLRRLGVKEDNIHVMVNEEQLEAYQNKLESSKIVYPLEEQKTKNIGKIRNGIISKFNDDDLNILLDDDIKEFFFWEENKESKYGDRIKVLNISELISKLKEKMIDINNFPEQKPVKFINIVPTDSNFGFYFARNGEDISLYSRGTGALTIIVDNTFRFPELELYEDGVASFYAIKNNEYCPRINSIGMRRLPERNTKGGIEYTELNNKENEIFDFILKEFKGLVYEKKSSLNERRGIVFNKKTIEKYLKEKDKKDIFSVGEK